MSTIAPSAPQATSGLIATLRHARYIISDNPVTGLAFGLFVIIVLLAAVRTLYRSLRSAWPATPRPR